MLENYYNLYELNVFASRCVDYSAYAASIDQSHLLLPHPFGLILFAILVFYKSFPQQLVSKYIQFCNSIFNWL